jgi:signal transduction histidine kinase
VYGWGVAMRILAHTRHPKDGAMPTTDGRCRWTNTWSQYDYSADNRAFGVGHRPADRSARQAALPLTKRAVGGTGSSSSLKMMMENKTELVTEIRKFSDDFACPPAHTAPRSQHARVVAELTQAVHARDAFMAIAAHELRNPMTPLLGYAEHILSGGARKVSAPKRSLSRWSAWPA